MKKSAKSLIALGAIIVSVASGCSSQDLESKVDGWLSDFQSSSQTPNTQLTEIAVSSEVSLESLTDASVKLNKLAIRSEGESYANQSGYDSSLFGYPANNVTDYGWPEEVAYCNTRGAVLYTYSQYPEFADETTCELSESNYWTDKYGFYNRNTGSYEFLTSDNPRDFDAEHIVARKDAWVSGAHSMDESTRFHIGNDPENFLLASASSNRSKGDSSPEDYLPVGEDRCIYVERYIKVKSKYGLSITDGDYAALNSALNECIDSVK